MQETHCPFCETQLETIDVAPCWDCGWSSQEIKHALTGIHTYHEVRAFGALNIVLCDFCQVDFGSYHADFFGLPADKRQPLERLQFVREAVTRIGKDKFCPECKMRLAFIRFVQKARIQNQNS